ncbi:dienelactone hydrolase family protein [Aspergillus clavatus NRRL 1]|uniref:Dienelactone hydrolase family protein n=1 Tax=Aspergillus clavatus (strain ATCC 1007 / CBS 513.65 / DSM 816 / NCTC 3887 / NRRL 1 / QM 1276 / 107) TaxID=344612 RepID=A1CHI9_ASPCL|nr:dienelactone hydrolase family protein [Aspergillus clavatus NRRL 1]EAW10344.1 dienelactone hydrolase family protein [Aspergillus clavatus NRRL 1]
MSCPDCFSGHVHSGEPQGQVTKLHGLDVYVASPAGDSTAIKGIVIIIPDAFGWEFVNNRILADHYAQKSKYKVYLPEFMNGNACPTSAITTMRDLYKNDTLSDWLWKPYYLSCAVSSMVPFMYSNRFSKAWPVVKSFFAAVRQNEGSGLPIGAAGFCWGGKYVVNLVHGAEVDGKPLIDAGFTGHPSFLKIPEEIEKIRIPVSFAMGELDMVVKKPQVEQIQRIVDSKGVGEVRVYSGAGHGFCVRADHVLDNAEKQAAEAEDQALEWFNRHFANVSY